MEASKFVIAFCVLILFAGCTSQEKQVSGERATAAALLPHSSNYNERELSGETAVATGGIVTAALASQPATATFSAYGGRFTQKFIVCLKDEGVSTISLYTHKSDVADVGIMAVGEENTGKILDCLVQSAIPFCAGCPPPKKYGLCGAKWAVKDTAGHKYYAVFLGTTDNVCHTLCDTTVNGCVYSTDVAEWYIYEEQSS